MASNNSFYVESPGHLVPSTPCFQPRRRHFCKSPEAEVPQVDLPLLPETLITDYENEVGLLASSLLNAPRGQRLQTGNTSQYLSRTALYRTQVTLGERILSPQDITCSPLRVTLANVRDPHSPAEQMVPSTPPETNTVKLCRTPEQTSLSKAPASPNAGKSMATESQNPENSDSALSMRSKLSLSRSRARKQKQRLRNMSLPPCQAPPDIVDEQVMFLFSNSEDDIFC